MNLKYLNTLHTILVLFIFQSFLVSNFIAAESEVLEILTDTYQEDYPEDDFEEDFYEEEEEDYSDPLYYFNYSMYTFNDRLYFWLLKPTAQGYSKILPEKGRKSVHNFFLNLMTPRRFVNCLLQQKYRSSWSEISAFAINSTLGCAGFFNPAGSRFNYIPSGEDMGQTLGNYGLKNGFYLVLPFLGPSALRDGIGLAGDRFLNPLSYLPLFENIGGNALGIVNKTSLSIGDYEELKKTAFSPYVALRDIYLQHRIEQVKK